MSDKTKIQEIIQELEILLQSENNRLENGELRSVEFIRGIAAALQIIQNHLITD